MTTSQTLRDYGYKYAPQWLSKGNAQKLLWSIRLQLDGLTDRCIAGVKMRFPGLYSFESLSTIGRDRRIRRGRNETDLVYAGRLLRWLTDHRTRGGAYAMLAQLHAYFAAAPFPIHLLYKSGVRFVMDVDGTITKDFVPPAQPQARWARWTLFYFTNEYPTPDDVTPDDAHELTLIPKEWIAAHVIGKLNLMPDGAELWDYHVPPRKWNNHSKWNKQPGTSLEI
jgi:hypothetical protein